MAETILPLIGPEALSPDWHALRKFSPDRQIKVVFGATESAGCCGMSPYKTPFEIFVRKKLGIDQEENDAMRRGKRFEGPILDEYEDVRKVKLRRGLPMFMHGKYHWMGATPDALANDGDVCGDYPVAGDFGVDAKSSTYRRLDKEGGDPLKFGTPGTDELPVDYVFQGQAQCAVLNLPHVDFPVMFSRDYVPIYRVERNEDLIKFIIHAEQEMYERLVNDEPPEPTWTHENTKEMIGLAFGREEKLVHQLDEDDLERWLSVQRMGDEMKTLDEQIKSEKNRLLFKMGKAAYGVFPSGEQQLKRIVIKDSFWSSNDVEEIRSKIGSVKRKGHERLQQVKVKEE